MLAFGLANTVAVWLDGGVDLTGDQLAEHFAHLCVAAAAAIRAG